MSAWTWFADKVMECITGKRVWGKEKTMKLMCKVCSISNEVFALLILYNNWDKWCAEMSTPPQKVDTYFTSNQMGSHKFQGWSDEEIAKYNELFEWIETDHQTPHGKQGKWNTWINSKQQEVQGSG